MDKNHVRRLFYVPIRCAQRTDAEMHGKGGAFWHFSGFWWQPTDIEYRCDFSSKWKVLVLGHEFTHYLIHYFLRFFPRVEDSAQARYDAFARFMHDRFLISFFNGL